MMNESVKKSLEKVKKKSLEKLKREKVKQKISIKKTHTFAIIATNFVQEQLKISFALLRSSILGIRGSRTIRRSEIVDASMEAVVEEGRPFV